jgi:hypothetical protein
MRLCRYMTSPDLPVIVAGENGTLAEEVDDNSPRPDFTLVAAPNCSDRAPDNLYTCADQVEPSKP